MAKQRSLPFLVTSAFLAGALLAAGCAGTQPTAERAGTEDPSVVAVYADEVLTLTAFEEAYARSLGGRQAAQDDSLAAYQDFLQRYVNFRLKVIEGVNAGYTRDPAIREEIRGYRASFAKPYLLDKSVINPIIVDLYTKSQEMVDASHILLRVAPDAPPTDTMEAYTRISALRDSVLQGVDFGRLAFRHSEDPSAQGAQPGQPGHRGRLGFFSAGRMVEAFEHHAYATPPGQVSPVFRTQYGYHILFVNDRRPIVPDIRVSHIMTRPAGPTAADSAEALKEITALEQRLRAGEDFAALAREFSADKVSARQGGDLGYLRFDNYQVDKSFREAAFAIDSLNAVSEVITTPYGYHLLMITDRKKPGTIDEEYEALKKIAANLPRTKQAEEKLAADIRARYGLRVDSTALHDAVAGIGLDSLVIKLRAGAFPEAVLNTPVVTLGDSTYAFRDVTTYAHTNRIQRMQTGQSPLWVTLDAFLDQIALQYEAAALESRDDEFRAIMQEFRDGLILFKLMEDSVWTAAAQDSLGLQAYYDAHRARYRFPERTRIVSLTSPSDSLLRAAAARLDDGLSPGRIRDALALDSTETLKLDTVLVAGKTDSVYDYALDLEEGAHTAVIPNRPGHVVLLRDGTEPPRPKTLEEARTEVINDYQQVLEDRLIQRLRAKYEVHTFPERLDRAFMEVPKKVPAETDTAAPTPTG